MFFEPAHSLTEHEFLLAYSSTKNFPLHIHRSFEYFEQLEGSTEVQVGDRTYVLEAGETVLVFPFQPHSYVSIKRGQIRLCIFSPDLVANYYEKNKSKLPTDNKFLCRLPRQDLCLENPFHKKSFCYFICGEFEQNRAYETPPAKTENKLLTELLWFAEQSFTGSCLLRDAAAEIGYDYAYISKFFKAKVGVSFRQYVNRLRVTQSKHLLKTTDLSIEEIGASCGFSSLRAFDREFHSQTHTSPSEYRKMKKR